MRSKIRKMGPDSVFSACKGMAARAIVLCFLVLLFTATFADTLTGKVVKITDGDTLYVLDTNYKEHKIRLAGIDAPERKQAYGLASRKRLASMVAGQLITPTRASETNGCVRISLSPAFYRPYVVPPIHLTVLNNCEPPL